MRLQSAVAASAAFASTVSAQGMSGGPNGNHGNGGNGAGYGSPFAGAGSSCMNNCWSDLGGVNWNNGGLASLCSNATAIDNLNSCISGSSCSSDDKQGTYQALAQICANSGNAVSASPEATFSATSGGTAFPTSNSAWASYASSFATITGAPTANPFYNASGSTSGWAPGAGYGPFGKGGQGGGWGPWASDSTGSWTTGPWTNWWGTSGCPPSTWSGWTSGPWGTNAPWTTWTGCTASTTGSSVMTSTVTTAGSASVVTTTAFGVQVAQATNAASGSTSTASATNSASAGERRTIASAGVGLGGFLIALLMM